MNAYGIIRKLELIDKECRRVRRCSRCKFKCLCKKYCVETTPRGMIYYLKNLEELEGDK